MPHGRPVEADAYYHFLPGRGSCAGGAGAAGTLSPAGCCWRSPPRSRSRTRRSQRRRAPLLRAALDHCLDGRELQHARAWRARWRNWSGSRLMSSTICELGVNIDHVATLRQARGTRYPDPVQAALIAEQAGADNITLHLREDRRHIQERDVRALARAADDAHEPGDGGHRRDAGLRLRDCGPPDCCLVPERRAELTTEGGLDVRADLARARARPARGWPAPASAWRCSSTRTRSRSTRPPTAGAPVIELHTGAYAEASGAAPGAGARAAAGRGRATRRARRPRGACRPRAQLPQRRAGGGDRRDRRAQHRPRDRRAGAVRRPAGRRCGR